MLSYVSGPRKEPVSSLTRKKSGSETKKKGGGGEGRNFHLYSSVKT